MEKLQFLREHGIDMHAQVVLVPGYNDGDALVKTVEDLYAMNDRMLSLSIVPVGLTRHRRELTDLRPLRSGEARALADQVRSWQDRFRAEIGRGFVYLSDEMYLLAGLDFPEEDDYDGYPLMENGVGMSRDFLAELEYQRSYLPDSLETPRKLTLVSGTLTAPLLEERVAPVLRSVKNLEVEVVAAENLLFGDVVTVSGLLNFKSFYAALRPLADEGRLGDLVLLPPDCVNFEGLFLDNREGQNTPDDLARALGGANVDVFDGDWVDAIERLGEPAATGVAAG
jgi:NifB/MoaA-like Fe-S oxidoreductase